MIANVRQCAVGANSAVTRGWGCENHPDKPWADGATFAASVDERLVAAIFVPDVVGYSRLMGQDEAGTFSILHL